MRWRFAESGGAGEVRFLGEVENRPATIEKTINKLAKRYDRLHVCFEAGPTGYGLCRQVRDLGHDCMVVAPALIPKRSGERVRQSAGRGDPGAVASGRRDDQGLGSRYRARGGARCSAREAGSDDLRRKRQQLLSFLLRHGRMTRRRSLDVGAPALARAHGATDCLPGEDRRDRRRSAASPVGHATGRHRAGLVMAPVIEAYQPMRGVSFWSPRLLRPKLGMCTRLRYAPTADDVPRPGSGRTLNRRYDPTVGACGQSTRPPDLGRSRLDLPLSAKLADLQSTARRIAQSGARHRLEGAGPAPPVIAASAPRQEGARGRGRDRTRNGSLPLGHWPRGRAVAVEAALPVRCTAPGVGPRRGTPVARLCGRAIPPEHPPLKSRTVPDEDTEGGTQPRMRV